MVMFTELIVNREWHGLLLDARATVGAALLIPDRSLIPDL